jgi:hypothetical protein
LARRPADEQIAVWRIINQLGEVTMERNIRVMVRKNRARERFNLRKPDGLPIQVNPRSRSSLNTRTDGQIF